MNRELQLEEAWRWWSNRMIGSEFSNVLVDYAAFRVGEERRHIASDVRLVHDICGIIHCPMCRLIEALEKEI